MTKGNNYIHSPTNGFSKLNHAERVTTLKELKGLSDQEVNYLLENSLPSIELAEKLVENVIAYFPLPLGVAVNFRIDDQDYIIPMAVEETSIIAAASKTAKWIYETGNIKTETIGKNSIGQIQLARVKNVAQFEKIILENKEMLIEEANTQVVSSLVKRGGGVRDLYIRQILRGDGDNMVIIHVLVDTCDAMGANNINQVCEFLKTPIQNLTGEKVTMCILSNLNDSKLTRATVTLHQVDPEFGEKIEEASLFAELDPYRAATSNKGVLNGMDSVLIATGNDWRAVESGVHSYACRDGQYRAITKWRMRDGDLIGVLEAPIMLGIVGGVTTLHPTAQISLKILNITNANHLARIVAAVGLVQNLGAIRALTTVGIIEGHMKLHIDNLILNAGANEDEFEILKKRLIKEFENTKRITLSNAIEILKDIRN